MEMNSLDCFSIKVFHRDAINHHFPFSLPPAGPPRDDLRDSGEDGGEGDHRHPRRQGPVQRPRVDRQDRVQGLPPLQVGFSDGIVFISSI